MCAVFSLYINVMSIMKKNETNQKKNKQQYQMILMVFTVELRSAF